jgi:hypothetical protein
LSFRFFCQAATSAGYRGAARHVGFRYDADLDDLLFDDGLGSGNAATWAWHVYRRHTAVGTLLDGVGIGLGEWPATHWLLIDREAGRASIAPADEARRFLRQQHPAEPELSPEQGEELRRQVEEAVARGWHEVRLDPEEVRRSMQEQRARIGRMVSWLEQCPVPPQGQEGRPPAR